MGVPFVLEMPEWKGKFIEVFEKINNEMKMKNRLRFVENLAIFFIVNHIVYNTIKNAQIGMDKLHNTFVRFLSEIKGG